MRRLLRARSNPIIAGAQSERDRRNPDRVQLYQPPDGTPFPPSLANKRSSAIGGVFLAGPVTFPSDGASSEEKLSWLRGTSERCDDDSGPPRDNPVAERERMIAVRRARNRYLASQIESGGARIDADGRIVPVAENENEEAENVHDPNDEGDRQAQNNANANVLRQPLHFLENAENIEFVPIIPGGDRETIRPENQNQNGNGNRPGPWRMRRQQQQGGGNQNINNNANNQHPPAHAAAAGATFRRICFAVFAVVMAFVCISLQTLPLLEEAKQIDPVLDPILKELVIYRDIFDHLVKCGDLGRDAHSSIKPVVGQQGLADAFRYQITRLVLSTVGKSGDCSDGVLHIPTIRAIRNRRHEHLMSMRIHRVGEGPASDLREVMSDLAAIRQIRDLHEPYSDGVNVTWTLPCISSNESQQLSSGSMGPMDEMSQTCSSTKDPRNNNWFPWQWRSNMKMDCPASSFIEPNCFRGIYDGYISSKEVDDVLYVAADLISQGGDHIEIRRDVLQLKRSIPSVLSKVEELFHEKNGVKCGTSSHLVPVAYRIEASLPMEGETLKTFIGSIHSKYLPSRRGNLVNAVNSSLYHEWEAQNRLLNDRPSLDFLRQFKPFAPKPFRDPCVLLSEQQRSQDFRYHSSVFLSDGAGVDHTGGTELFVDSHRSNNNPRRRIQRGVLIDPSRGRIVLSSGGKGKENLRCKMPTRWGIRAVLDIWWDCE